MLRTFASTRAGVIGLALSALVVGGVFVKDSVFVGEDRVSSFRGAIAAEGLALVGAPVFVDPPSAVSSGLVLFTAERAEDDQALSDLYAAYVKMRGDTAVFALSRLSNLSRTSGAAETQLIRAGDVAAYVSQVDGQTDAVTVVQLSGEPASVTADWPRRAKVQNAITNFQETGRSVGFGRLRVALDPPATDVTLSAEELGSEVQLFVELDGERLMVDPRTGESESPRLVAQPSEKGQPGKITWVVDSVRNLSFVGPEPIAWLEHRVFTAKDWAQRQWYAAIGRTETETVAEVADELGIDENATEEQTLRRAELSATDPEIGWPPARLTPIIPRPVEGEGEWNAVVDDPFLSQYPNAPPPFATTFLQVDPDRPWTRVYVVVWDARQVQLRVMTGTREPESATGATGRGRVPRDQNFKRLIGAFNGGFQSLHGEFGMMSEGRVYLPPKPWAATVAVFEDGHVGMGSWSDPPEGVRHFREGWALRQIPDEMVEMRQNLTSVVEGELWNPWRRWWWGAAPADADEQVYIDRSGLCLTREGFFAYFWGKSMGAEELGKAMIAARCVRGMHLDMNQRHTAFEFYNVRDADRPFPSLGRRRHRSEFELRVPNSRRRFIARGRLLAKSMSPMRMPRYIQTDPRDFFYLTQKPLLPGPNLPLAGAQAAPVDGEGEARAAEIVPETRELGEDGRFDSRGLPNNGWPHTFARTWLAGEGDDESGRAWLVRIDPRRAAFDGPAPNGEAERPRALAWWSGAQRTGELALYSEHVLIEDRFAVGAPPEDAKVVLYGSRLADVPDAPAAVGVDGDGFIVYAERGAQDSTSLRERLQRAGVDDALALGDTRLVFQLDDDTTIGPDAYERELSERDAIAIRIDEREETEVLFPNVEPRPYMYWGIMQDTRVRYFRDPDRPRRFATPQDAAP